MLRVVSLRLTIYKFLRQIFADIKHARCLQHPTIYVRAYVIQYFKDYHVENNLKITISLHELKDY